MSSIATATSSSARPGPRAPWWIAARPQTRVGIEFDDDGFRVAAIRLTPRSASLNPPELKIQWLHRVSERTPPLEGNLAAYLDALTARLPRYATRGGVATSIAMPASAQSLRCVPSSQLAEAERGIADELGGEVHCCTWQVGSQKSMICGVRSDIAESIISILRDLGYRCESILPRSVSLARALLAATVAREPNATILCWGRQRTLVTMIHDQTIRLCREFVIPESIRPDRDGEEEKADASDAPGDRLTQVTSEVAHELMQTLQHASRLNHRTVFGPIVVCGVMSVYPQAIESLRAAMAELFDGDVKPWSFPLDDPSPDMALKHCDRADVVSASLAVGGSRFAIDKVQAGAMPR